MTKETLNNILVFLNRVQLTGQEVPVFNSVIAELQRELAKTVEENK